MNRAHKGRRNEYKSRRVFEALNYRVTRAAASLGVFDLIAIGPTDIVLCQVKSNRGLSPADREEVERFPCPPNCRKLIHRWKDYGRLPEVEEVP